jgi:hypothetical protein
MRYLASALYLSPLYAGVAGYLYAGPYGIAAALLPAAVIAIGIKTHKLPIVRWQSLKGANGRNWPLLVIMDPEATYPLAVLAQELYEAEYKVNPLQLIYTRTGEGARELELKGHEVEVQAAVRLYGASETEYRKAEARSMAVGYKQFAGWEPDNIELAMMGHTSMAQRWVSKNIDRLRN